MKPLIKNLLFALVAMVLFVSPAANGFAAMTGLSRTVSFITLFTAPVILHFIIPVNKNANGRITFTAGIQVEIWVNYIIERLWKDNKFLKYAWNDDDKVLAGKVVHIPNPGARPVTTVNRTVFPATAVRRTDTDIVYALNEFTTQPTHIEDAEKVEVSYDKISSVIGDHMGYLTEDVADNMLLAWLDESVTIPAKIFTSGAEAAASGDEIDGAPTGNRKQMVAADVRKAQLQMNLQKIPKTDRYALIEANMLDQLLGDLSNTQYRDFSSVVNPTEGILGRLYGFTILDRSSTAVYDTNNALKPFGAIGAATDNLSSMFWHKDAVTRALGEVKMFSNVNRPEYYGDIYSALLRMGGRRRRGDDKGIIALLQAA